MIKGIYFAQLGCVYNVTAIALMDAPVYAFEDSIDLDTLLTELTRS
jgi:hypothetical protein